MAVLAVVVYHFSPSLAPGGFLGVDVFFVLSGFLITSLLVSEYGVATKISLRSFWIRRARRYVGVLDSGVFLRDRNGVYQWRMPRLPLGEIGCGSTGTVGVRWAGDGGRHFCADPSWDGSHCQAEFAAGERRLAAALAQQIFERFGT